MSSPPPYDLKTIAEQINTAAVGHRMGEFQDLRARIKGRRRVARHVFVPRAGTFNPTWAYHYGGRTELQFNIGLELRGDAWWFRYGIAFSLEPSRSLPDPGILLPHILRYNDYMRENGARLAGMRLWYYGNHGNDPSQDIQDKIITEDILTHGHFFFIGQRSHAEAINTDQVITVFDQLLDVYVAVESQSYLLATPTISPKEFTLTPRLPPHPTKITVSWAQRHIDVDQRHRELEQALFDCLCTQYGKETVFPEQDTGNGMKIDVVLQRNDGLWLYEIKTSTCVRSCIRDGLAQLMEYSFWPTALNALKLIVVGEPPTDAGARSYLATLRKRFALPVYYSRLDYDKKTLGPEE